MRRPSHPVPAPAVPRTPDTLAAIRSDPVPERRLLRLQRLVRALPVEARAAHWAEAGRLAASGGDSGRLLLIGFARHLAAPLPATARATLHERVREVHDPAKRSLAWLALDEVAPLGSDALADAWNAALRIPNEPLRIMILTRLARRVV